MPLSQWNASGIRRFTDDAGIWRVVVETWLDWDGYRGRVVFEPDRAQSPRDRLEGPDKLYGPTREAVVAEAVDLPEERLRQLFRSLS